MPVLHPGALADLCGKCHPGNRSGSYLDSTGNLIINTHQEGSGNLIGDNINDNLDHLDSPGNLGIISTHLESPGNLIEDNENLLDQLIIIIAL